MTAVIQKPLVLCISATDPLGLSGVQADLRALNSMNVHGLSCITATTAQNQNEFVALNSVSDEVFSAQLDAIHQQFNITVIKLGLIATASQFSILKFHPILKNAKLVLDPVVHATAGDIENHKERLAALKSVLPLCSIITPNLDEAKQLCGSSISHTNDLIALLLKQGCDAVLLKGGHGENASTDVFSDGMVQFYLEHDKHEHGFSRGTGCTMASLIAGSLALGASNGDAVTMAKMQMAKGWSQPFAIDDTSGSLMLNNWVDPIEFAQKIKEQPNGNQSIDLPVALPIVYGKSAEKNLSFPRCDQSLGLYPIFDRAHWLERILPLGITIAQLRIKDLQGQALKDEIQNAVNIAQKYNCMLFINDYWQLAIELGAYGVHLGQEDIDDADLHAISKAGLRLGLSSHCFYEVARAKTIQPSYIAFGPVFETQTKDMPWIPQGPDGLCYWRKHLPDTPMVAIGGIHGQRFNDVKATGVDSIAMITAITLNPKPEEAARKYMEMFGQPLSLI